MVRSLVDFCVRRSVPVTLLMWTLLIGGAVALASMRREFFPETAPQAARIVLVYPGASPKEIEESMARKIEDRVVDVEGVDRIETRLSEGTGGITVKLKAGTDADKAIEDIRLAIEQINDLPPEAERVRVFDFKPNFPTIMVTLASDAGEEYIKRELRAIRGQLVRVERGAVERFTLDDYDPRGVTYVIPRSQDCILGGSADDGREELIPSEATTTAILERCAALEPRLAQARVLSVSVGLRPARSAVRLERESPRPGSTLIHNYGHGGAGVTLSWGCAHEVAMLATLV